jgi:dipeptidyl aminopeptidase/acylaminoacyl peptidase
LVKLYSNELQVNAQTPSTFITHAMDDKVVPIANSILFISACKQYGVPVQSYFYALGGHGYGIKNPTANKQWIDECIDWLLKLKF